MLNEHFNAQGFKREDLVVVSPDEGSIKRAFGHATRLGGRWPIVDKRRISADTTRQENIIGGSVKGKIALMFDDMISTAGSIAGAAKVLKEHGAREIHVAATHGVLVGPAIERLELHRHRHRRHHRLHSAQARANAPQNQSPLRRAPPGRGHQTHPPQRIRQHALRVAFAVRAGVSPRRIPPANPRQIDTSFPPDVH